MVSKYRWTMTLRVYFETKHEKNKQTKQTNTLKQMSLIKLSQSRGHMLISVACLKHCVPHATEASYRLAFWSVFVNVGNH